MLPSRTPSLSKVEGMRRTLALVTAASIALLSGCTASVDPGDKEACTVWSKAEKAMLQTISIIVEVTKDPAGMTDDVAKTFNTARNELLVAYGEAAKVAKSKTLQDALAAGLDADSVIYYDLAGATNERMQKSIAAVGTVVSTCLAAGIDVTSVLGTKK